MNKDLIQQFKFLQTYFQKEGDKGRSIAYGKIIGSIRSLNKEITKISDVKGVRGIGPKAIDKIKEFLDTGTIQTVEDKKKELKKEEKLSEKEMVIQDFTTIWGIGEKKGEKLYNLGMRSFSDLKRNKNLLTAAQIIGLKHRKDLLQKVPRDLITSLYVIITTFLNKKFGKDTFVLKVAGSYRRKAKFSGDMDCLLTSEEFTLQEAVKYLEKKNIITDILSVRDTKFMGIAHCPGENSDYKQHIRLDIEFVPKEQWGSALLYFTGSKDTNIHMRSVAIKKGMVLNEYGLFKEGKKVLKNPSEREIFEELGMTYLKPENR